MADEGTEPKTTSTTDEQFKDPLGVTAEEQGEDKVKVQIVIPGLATKTKLLKRFSKQPSNAVIEPPEFTEWGFSVIVRMKDKSKQTGGQNFKARIKKLPGSIDPENCSYEVKKEQVVLTLQKKTTRSWAAKLSEYGLEQAEDEDEEMEEGT